LASILYVFFDVDDTLIQWTASWEDAFARAAQEAGAQVTPEQAYEALNTAFSTFYPDCLRKHAPLGDETEFWLDYDARILEMLGVKQHPRRAAARVADFLKRPDSIRLFPEVPEVLQALDDMGARLGILTGRPRAAPDLEALGVLHYFGPIVDGLSAGDSKRIGSALFAHAAETVSAAGAVGWHVGDSYSTDVQPALAAGLRGVLVDRRGRHPNADCPRITDLSGLLEVLDTGRDASGAMERMDG